MRKTGRFSTFGNAKENDSYPYFLQPIMGLQ